VELRKCGRRGGEERDKQGEEVTLTSARAMTSAYRDPVDVKEWSAVLTQVFEVHFIEPSRLWSLDLNDVEQS